MEEKIVYDQNVLIANINKFAIDMNISYSEMEKLMDVSQGYLKRTLMNAEKNSVMGVDKLYKLSRGLGICMDSFLIQQTSEELHEEVRVIDEYISKYAEDTKRGELLWEKVDVGERHYFSRLYGNSCKEYILKNFIYQDSLDDEEMGIYELGRVSEKGKLIKFPNGTKGYICALSEQCQLFIVSFYTETVYPCIYRLYFLDNGQPYKSTDMMFNSDNPEVLGNFPLMWLWSVVEEQCNILEMKRGAVIEE